MQRPNALSAADFEQWVQERGLYFPSAYEGYTTALSITESTGTVYENSTVVASYGKGSVIYTGLSLFRELPKGVPGALRLTYKIYCTMTVKNTSIINWKKYYIGVVALLVAEIVAFYFITRQYV